MQFGTLTSPVRVTRQGSGPNSWRMPLSTGTIVSAERLVYADDAGNRFVVKGSTARQWDSEGQRVLVVAEHLGGPRDGIEVTAFLYPVGGA